MVDLFGKRKLEDRIQELEASLARLEGEAESLSRTLEKRDEKIRKLSGSLQEASLALKAAGQKPTSAAVCQGAATQPGDEDEPGRGHRPAPSESQMVRPEGRRLDSREMDGLLERLSAIRSPRDDLLTAYFSGPVPDDGPLAPALRDAARAISSPRGEILLHCPELFSLLLVPPFPVIESRFEETSAFLLDPIREMLETAVLIVSAHAGDSFLAVALSQERFEAEETVRSSVMGRHSKGGWSQKRFERLRDEDIKSHIDQVQRALDDFSQKYGALVRYAILTGEESLLRQIAPALKSPVVERKLARHNEKDLRALREEVYGFVCYRLE